ncbi:hypothetical protein APY94_12640 [Thermococcus celericrescens]|uniref:Uncharacterized protein n=2 Tax=Thermococcus celericrescens TaxID=227598 RepID=A0A117ISR0_9EURY|nr:hypothetical protein APY94_12640 [Thermococcus celericrescens]
MEVRRLTGLRKDYAPFVVILFCSSIAAYLRGMDFLGTFLLALGFGLFSSSMGRYLVILDGGEYMLSARKRGSVYEVKVLRDGSPLWSGKVLDYVRLGELALDTRSDGVAVVFREKEVGKLP